MGGTTVMCKWPQALVFMGSTNYFVIVATRFTQCVGGSPNFGQFQKNSILSFFKQATIVEPNLKRPISWPFFTELHVFTCKGILTECCTFFSCRWRLPVPCPHVCKYWLPMVCTSEPPWQIYRFQYQVDGDNNVPSTLQNNPGTSPLALWVGWQKITHQAHKSCR